MREALDAAGISRQKIRKIGMDASDTAQLFFDDVRVPLTNVIGQEGMGFTFQMMQFQEERLWGAAGSLRTPSFCTFSVPIRTSPAAAPSSSPS